MFRIILAAENDHFEWCTVDDSEGDSDRRISIPQWDPPEVEYEVVCSVDVANASPLTSAAYLLNSPRLLIATRDAIAADAKLRRITQAAPATDVAPTFVADPAVAPVFARASACDVAPDEATAAEDATLVARTLSLTLTLTLTLSLTPTLSLTLTPTLSLTLTISLTLTPTLSLTLTLSLLLTLTPTLSLTLTLSFMLHAGLSLMLLLLLLLILQLLLSSLASRPVMLLPLSLLHRVLPLLLFLPSRLLNILG